MVPRAAGTRVLPLGLTFTPLVLFTVQRGMLDPAPA
jgi:hypothetical protein